MDKRPSLLNGLTNLLLPITLVFGLVLLLNLDPGTGAAEATVETPLEPWLKLVVSYLAVVAEIAAAVVIGVAVVRAIGLYFFRQLRSLRHLSAEAVEDLRLELGRALTLGLEFTVASDILRTAVAPTRQDILTLGAIVMLRTLLNYFLEREIAQVEARREAPAVRTEA